MHTGKDVQNGLNFQKSCMLQRIIFKKNRIAKKKVQNGLNFQKSSSLQKNSPYSLTCEENSLLHTGRNVQNVLNFEKSCILRRILLKVSQLRRIVLQTGKAPSKLV